MMNTLFKELIDQTLADYWDRIDSAYKKALLAILCVNFLAYGFEMTNLTINQDDIAHIFIEDDILGHYLGRFGLGWIHYRLQNAHIMPFLQLVEGVVAMTAYGMLIAAAWGLRRTTDIAVVASILSVFPYTALIHQYNALVFPYATAHLLTAGAVVISTRPTVLGMLLGAFLYAAAFSIYQTVIANAATIFVFWALSRLLFGSNSEELDMKSLVRSALSAIVTVVSGGALYLTAISVMDINFGVYQSADRAFSVDGRFTLQATGIEIIEGTRSFFVWPEHYYSGFLKSLQLVFLVGAGTVCVIVPKRWAEKTIAVMLFILGLFTPRVLQLLHPEGNYHSLTLTAYAVTVSGFVMILLRAGPTVVRNLSIVLAFLLVAGYIMQSNWISTVNYLNTLAHISTYTQILSRINMLPDGQWNNKEAVVVGRYRMKRDPPYKPAIGVASQYIDAKHLQHLSRLMRQDINFLPAEFGDNSIAEYAASHKEWPAQASVGIVDGKAVVVLSKDRLGANAGRSKEE
jgi:hypothetical protein